MGPAEMIRSLLRVAAVMAISWTVGARTSPADDARLNAQELTFFVVSDTHYGLGGDEALGRLVDEMNRLPGTAFPDASDGVVGRPRGVIHLGDCTNDAKPAQWQAFIKDFGVNGEGRLKFPCYETFGNHDGGPESPVRLGIKARNQLRRDLTAISPEGMHYAWRWDGIHFIQLGVSIGGRFHPYDPQDSLSFLKDYLKRHVRRGEPLVLLHHFGFDPGHSLRWWTDEARDAYLAEIRGHNVAAIFHGHAHRPEIYRWQEIDVFHPPHIDVPKPPKPKDAEKAPTADAQANSQPNNQSSQTSAATVRPVRHGFFVVRISAGSMLVAQRNLDGSWGTVARKALAAAAQPTSPQDQELQPATEAAKPAGNAASVEAAPATNGPSSPKDAASAPNNGRSPPAAEPSQSSKKRDVLFISTSDSHYDAFESEDRNARNRDTIAEINAIEQRRWPDKLGGGPIGRPRGVLVLGDCIDDGDRLFNGKPQSARQFEFFVKDFGLNGSDGLLRFPVFEGWGNHDGPPEGAEKHGFSFQAQLKKRNRQRLAAGLIDHVSENGLHYAWNWDDVRFVQLNIYPADRQRDGVRYSPVWHDPQQSLAFLKADLAEHVGRSGRPVLLMSHCGFDTDWWTPDDWNELYQAVKQYRVVLYLYGHSGTGVRRWAPKGETRPWLCINDGQTEKGFFVIHIADERIRAAYRMKSDVKAVKNPDRTETITWGGAWEWRWLVDEPLDPPPPQADDRLEAQSTASRSPPIGSTKLPQPSPVLSLAD